MKHHTDFSTSLLMFHTDQKKSPVILKLDSKYFLSYSIIFYVIATCLYNITILVLQSTPAHPLSLLSLTLHDCCMFELVYAYMHTSLWCCVVHMYRIVYILYMCFCTYLLTVHVCDCVCMTDVVLHVATTLH